jgi:rhodanese-related sulfurtransferase
LPNQLSKLKKETPVITCCASGMRSASAKSILKSNGFTEVHNGGSWMNLKRFEK